MKNSDRKFSSFQYLMFLTQVGLSVICPVILGVFLGKYLERRFELGSWVTVVLLLIGILCAGCSLAEFVRYALKESKKSEEERKKNGPFA